MAEQRTPDTSADETKAGASTVDVERIADRVYRLMLADVRLERARIGDTDQLRKG